MALGNYDIVGGKIMFIGDLHISDVFTGKHKDYLTNCFGILGRLTKEINLKKPSLIVLLGDIIGWTETNIKDRQVLSMFCKLLKEWREIAPIYAVRGNHDTKGYPDFLFLNELGLITTSDQIGDHFDYYGYEGQEMPEIRFHIVDYNDENKVLDYLVNDNTSNIVLGHNNYTIDGVTNWYQSHDGKEINMLKNFSNVDMIISGHIHTPSPEIYSTQLSSGKMCMLLYPGCPTRPIKERNLYTNCWLVYISYNATNKRTDIDTEKFELPPLSEIFFEDDAILNDKTEEEVQNEIRKDALAEIIADTMKYRITAGDPMEQVDNIPNASDEAKSLAKDYLQLAFNNTRVA